MKALIFILTFALSMTVFAKMTAIEALQKALPENQYEGIDEANERCIVDVIREPGQTRVELENTSINRFLVVENAPYTFDQAKEFFSTSISMTTDGGTNHVEITFSTKRIDPLKRLVTFQRVFRAGSNQWTSAQKCVIEN